MNESATFYEILDISPDADTVEIKRAYRELILRAHPDKQHSSATTGAGAVTGAGAGATIGSRSVSCIKNAYDILSNTETRAQYDVDLTKSLQTHGFNLNGDGLDSYSLETFDFNEELENWSKICPRCQTPASIKLTEENLEQGTDDGEGGLELLVQCGSCSLWIKVRYMEEA